MEVLNLVQIIKGAREDVVKEAFIGKLLAAGTPSPLLPSELFAYYPLNEYDYRLDSDTLIYIVDNFDFLVKNRDELAKSGIMLNNVSIGGFEECVQVISNEYELMTTCKDEGKWIVYHMNKNALMKRFVINIVSPSQQNTVSGIGYKDLKGANPPISTTQLRVLYVLNCDADPLRLIDTYALAYVRRYFNRGEYSLPRIRDLVDTIIMDKDDIHLSSDDVVKLYVTDYFLGEVSLKGYIIELNDEGDHVGIYINGVKAIEGLQMHNGDIYEIKSINLGKLRELGLNLEPLELYSCSLDHMVTRSISMLREIIRSSR